MSWVKTAWGRSASIYSFHIYYLLFILDYCFNTTLNSASSNQFQINVFICKFDWAAYWVVDLLKYQKKIKIFIKFNWIFLNLIERFDLIAHYIITLELFYKSLIFYLNFLLIYWKNQRKWEKNELHEHKIIINLIQMISFLNSISGCSINWSISWMKLIQLNGLLIEWEEIFGIL